MHGHLNVKYGDIKRIIYINNSNNTIQWVFIDVRA